MGQFVVVAFRPKPGKEELLHQLMAEHVPILQSLGLATEFPAVILGAANGEVVEIFEWVSREAIADAHSHPDVLKLWQRFGEVCDYIPLNAIAESGVLFPEFMRITPTNFDRADPQPSSDHS